MPKYAPITLIEEKFLQLSIETRILKIGQHLTEIGNYNYFKNSVTLKSGLLEKWTFGKSSWQPLANLPEVIFYSSAVPSYGNKYVGYLAGGSTGNKYPKDIFGLRRRDMTWIKMNKTMKTGRYLHSLLNIPAKQVLGC